MAQQTAIDWLIEQYIKDGLFKQGVYEQAKAMEKEQIIIAYDRGYIDGYPDNGKVGLDYYKESYNK